MEAVGKKVKKVFRIKLSGSQILKIAKEACEIEQRIERRTERLRGLKKLAEIKIKEMEEKRTELFQKIRSEEAEVELEANEVINFATGKVTYIDSQTNKVLQVRDITDDEKQLDFGIDIPDPIIEKNSARKCITCEEKYIGTGRICPNCRKLEAYRFAKEA